MFLGLHALRDVDTISQYVNEISSKKFEDAMDVASPNIAQEESINMVVQPDFLNHAVSNKKLDSKFSNDSKS